MKKVLSVLVVFAALCTAVAFSTLRGLKQSVRSAVIARVAEKTGQTVTIDEDVQISFSLSPYVQISGIKLSNPAWAQKPYMAEIDDLKIQVGFFPLMQRKAVVKKVELNKVRIYPEIGADGQKNWRFLEEIPAGPSKEGKPAKRKKTIDCQEMENVFLKDVWFSFSDRENGKEIEARVNALNLNRNKNGMEADARLSAGKEAVEATLKTEAVSEAQGKKSYKFLTKITGANISGEAEGTVRGPLSDIQGKAAVKLRLARLSDLNRFLGYSLPGLEDTSVAANVFFGKSGTSIPNFEIIGGGADTVSVEINGEAMSVSPLAATLHAKIAASNMGAVQGLPAWPKTEIETTVEFKQGLLTDNLILKVGESDLSGTFSFRTEKDFLVQTNLRSNQFRLADFLGKRYSAAPNTRPAAFSQSRKKDKMFSSDFLPFDALKAADINIDVSVNRLIGADGTDLGKVDLKAVMHDGVFSMPAFNLANYLLFQARFDASKQPADLNVGLKVRKMPLPLLFAQNKVRRGTVNGTLQLRGQGNSQAAIASSLNGGLFVDMRGVYADSFVMLSLPDVLSFLMPSDINQPLSVSCAVANLPVNNGLIVSERQIGAESNIADLQVNGKVNLLNETVDLKLEASPHSDKVLQTVFNSATISGTLENPVVGVDKDKVLDRALLIGSAFLFGGKQVMQEAMQQEKLKDVCAAALATVK